ncbi:hypothetical protein Ahu01nite_098160 [Winogradskya humida]|uniref:Uncharacterized protein n=2 Tax=Winogradskya humida TaxID=113566 RepID=A0ABQ4A7A4_9ACTN|nr:hypothetical protein Ahu01nite_098160 [Actinoplanes humidus]
MLQDAIRARLEAALDHKEGMRGWSPAAERGLATGGPDHPVIRLSLDDVVRLAALACEEWASSNEP